jgi:hypothetical protein
MNIEFQAKTSDNLKPYNLFKDGGFWVALFIGGSNIVYSSAEIVIPSILAFIAWVWWLYYKKGQKWSFLVGCLIWIAILFLGIPVFVMLDNGTLF